MYKRSLGGWAKHWDFILLDTLCLQLSLFVAYYIRFHNFGVYEVVGRQTTYQTAGLILLFLAPAISILFNTMHNVLNRDIWQETKSTIMQAVMVFAAIVVLLFTDKASGNASRIVFYITLGIYIILSFVTRLAYKQFVRRRKKDINSRAMVLVGDEAGVKRALAAFSAHPEAQISVKAIAPIGEFETGEKKKVELADAADYILNEWIDEVYIACVDYNLTPSNLISTCSEMAVTVHQQMFADDNAKGKQWIERIAKQPVITTSINIPKPRSLFFKRVIDIVAGFFMSLLALIVMAIVSPLIKKASPGPVLLKNERIGLNGKHFDIFTIRTMYMDARERLEKWKTEHPDDVLMFENDPRFIGTENGKTGIGAKLRKWSLDELPKGFNILLGQMSLVGVRAPSVAEWQKYEYRHRARLGCKPGLTGLWQASGKSKMMSFEEATALDTEYITNWSLELDWKILMKTAMLSNRKTNAEDS